VTNHRIVSQADSEATLQSNSILDPQTQERKKQKIHDDDAGYALESEVDSGGQEQVWPERKKRKIHDGSNAPFASEVAEIQPPEGFELEGKQM
jgi:hypothetical protein